MNHPGPGRALLLGKCWANRRGEPKWVRKGQGPSPCPLHTRTHTQGNRVTLDPGHTQEDTSPTSLSLSRVRVSSSLPSIPPPSAFSNSWRLLAAPPKSAPRWVLAPPPRKSAGFGGQGACREPTPGLGPRAGKQHVGAQANAERRRAETQQTLATYFCKMRKHPTFPSI